MRCNNCGKTVPNTTINCPYCFKVIDPKQVYVDKSLLEEESIASTPKDKMIEFAKKKENRGIVFGFIGVILLLIIIAIFGISSLFNKSGNISDDMFKKYVSNTYDHIMEAYFPSNGNSGKYSLNATVDGNKILYDGEYDLKLLDRYFYLSLDKGIDSNGSDIIISDEDNLKAETYLLNNILYINSKDFNNEELYFELPDKYGFLKTSKLNVKNLTNGVYDTFTEILKKKDYNSSKETIKIGDNQIKVNKISYEFDKKAKLDLVNDISKILKEDSSFLNEYSKMSGKTKEELISMIDGYKSTYTYKIKNSDVKSSYLNVYFDSKKIKRIELILVNENDTYNISLSFGNNTDYIVVKKNGDSFIDFTITKTEKELSNGIHKTLTFKYKDDKNDISGDLVLDTVNHPNIRKHTATAEAVNAYNLPIEKRNIIRNNTISLTGYNWFEPLIEYVKPICSSELTCTCPAESETCSCNQGTTFVTCLKSEIEKKNE